MVDIQQGTVVRIEVRTYLRMDTAGTLAFLTSLDVTSFHAVHIGRRSSEVREVPFEVGHLHYLFDFLENTLLRTTGNELALVGGDSTEGTAAKTTSVDIHAVLDHLIGRNTFPFVFWMRLTGIGQVEGGIQFLGCHGRIRWVDDDEGWLMADG